MDNQVESVVAGAGGISLYKDFLAKVRNDGKYHGVIELVQPNDPEVREIAEILSNSPDFIHSAQQFVNTFTSYENEQGDYWHPPKDTLAKEAGDCDCKSILLCSILRNRIPAEKIFCAFGLWILDGETTGHMWVVTEDDNGEDRVIESTAGPDHKLRGRYILQAMFNDQYCFATPEGLKEFDLHVVNPG